MPSLKIKHPQELMQLRRVALAAQGLLQTAPYGTGLAGARQAIEHLGYVQIDTLSVVERAHQHVLYSRVPKFQPTMTNQMLLAGDIFEYWSHAAAFLPSADFRYSLPYKHAIKSGQRHWYKNPDQTLMAELLARIRSNGPLRSRDLATPPQSTAGWWDWKPAKKALEQLYMQGDIMVSDRSGFQKTYDLTERVLPSDINTQMPSIAEYAEHLLQQQLRCHGLVSRKGITYLRRNAALRKAVQALVNENLAQGHLEQVQLNNGDVFVLPSNTLHSTPPHLNNRLLILSPFDNAVIQRERLKALFEFEYQIECYVPAAKRQYGYFCLPLLYRGEFIGRMDSKAHRKTRHLGIKALHFSQQNIDHESLMAAFTAAIKSFLHFQQCDSVSLTAVYPKQHKAVVQKALQPLEQAEHINR